MRRAGDQAGPARATDRTAQPLSVVAAAIAMRTGRAEGARFRIEDMLQAAVFPHATGPIELAETHISWVVLTGPYAYKIKKPVRFEFIDCSTLERRRMLCEEELRLNRRFAPGLYLDVVPIRAGPSGLQVDAQGDIVEYAVRMRQFERTEELAVLLARHAIGTHELADLGAQLAGFHAQAAAARPDGRWGSPAQLEALQSGNLASLQAVAAGHVATSVLAPLGEWLHTELARLRATIDGRRSAGRVRECHGDLHARNVVRWQGRLLPFDCLEFDPALRWTDVAGDIAFLHMDLLGHARADLSAAFLSAYLEDGGDYGALRLLRLFAVHRALVRAKVDALQATAAAAARCMARVELARRLIEPRTAAMILMHGHSGSGKSWLSEQLVPALGTLRVRSDVERKRLAGLGALDRSGAGAPGAGLYGGGGTLRTYARLAECARHALAAGQDIIVDAAFLQAGQRMAFRSLAHEEGCTALIVSCAAAPDVLRTRVQARERSGADPSDATLEVLERQLAEAEPLTPEEQAQALVLDTSAPTSIAALAAAIRQRLARP
ncbi:MAG: AAA family ATPase [Gammaproteobacteria bacterium]|nr:AAA family ATPase [Gammaproteobacteria bacterium]